jgi:signal peptide peptidase SppA
MAKHFQLLNKLFNTPLAVTPDYYRTVCGALADRLNIDKLTATDGAEDSDSLKQRAENFNEDRPEHRLYFYDSFSDGVAVLSIEGSLVHKYGYLNPSSGMTGYDGIKRRIDYALSDPECKQIMLDMDSPGGEVAGCFDLADYIYSLRGQKKITAFVNDLAGSACYAIASQCDEILISQTGRAGSIGVVMAHTNIKEALAKQGREITLIFSGDHKADGNPYEALPEKVRAQFKKECIEAHQQFAEKVAKGRGLSVETILNTQARIYSGQAAIDAGLADKIMASYDIIPYLISQGAGSNTNSLYLAEQPATQTAEVNMLDKNKAKVTPATSAAVFEDKSKLAAVDAPELDAGAAMQQRIAGIMDSEFSASHPGLSKHLAFSTSLSVDAAASIMAAAIGDMPAIIDAPNQDAAAAFSKEVAASSADAIAPEADEEQGSDQLARLLSAADSAGVS